MSETKTIFNHFKFLIADAFVCRNLVCLISELMSKDMIK